MKGSLTLKQSAISAVCLAVISWNVSAELDSGYEQAKKVSGLCPSNHDQPDAWNFAVCNCTSYVAYRLNLSGVQFTNQYGGVAK
ncbi:MAG: hypothetical protein WAU31_00210 [Candidatus Moraniibacteriota bacterium]